MTEQSTALHITQRTAYTLTCPLCAWRGEVTMRGVRVLVPSLVAHTGAALWRRLGWLRESEVRG
jgi:hypothetical protein